MPNPENIEDCIQYVFITMVLDINST